MRALESMTEFELECLWEWGIRKAEVRDALLRNARNQAAARAAHLIAEWRAANPQATCRPPIALILAELEQQFGA